jgi:hypothetical protein
LNKTGIFFLYLIGERLSDFPEELEGILNKPNISNLRLQLSICYNPDRFRVS